MQIPRKHFTLGSNQNINYIYDKTGRLVQDKNRNITLAYNILGLPRKINHTASPYGIEFIYDAAGNKLQKYLIDNHACPPNTTCKPAESYAIDYIGNFVYERGELKMIYHPEGVIRPIEPTPENSREYAYDYFIKDYLGNVRVVLTEEDATITEKFLTTLEEVHRTIEENNFDNLDETAADLPTGYPVDGSVEFNEKIALLSAANGTEIGPSIVLPVRRGDKVSLRTDYFYTQDAPGTTYDNLTMLVNEVLLALAASGSNILRLTEGQLTAIATGNSDHNDMLSAFFSSSFDTTDIHKPHAYLVWMLYDNDMKLMPSGSGVRRVTDPNALEELIAEEIPIEAEGYLHAYVSNGSASPVSFDNFLVTYIRGKTRQINHYYPYGLSIDALSRSDEYLNKYTGKELQTGEFNPNLSSGLEMYDFHARFYDPQVGRWFTPDPAEQFHNPYLAMGNNPVVYVDPDGEWVHLVIGAVIGGISGAIVGSQNDAKGWDMVKYIAIGAGAGALSAGVGAGASAAMAGNAAAGGGFIAGFTGTATISSTGFAAGAITGAAAGVTNGLITGTGYGMMGGQSFGDAFVSGGLNQAWKQGLSGAAIGGVSGGIQSKRNGGGFFEKGVMKKTVITNDIEPLAQDGLQDCLACAGESIAKAEGITLTQQQIRSDLGGNKDLDAIFNNKFGDYLAPKINRHYGIMDVNDFGQAEIFKEVKQGSYVVLSRQSSSGVGHALVVRKVVQKSFSFATSAATQSFRFSVMDPASGTFQKLIWNGFDYKMIFFQP